MEYILHIMFCGFELKLPAEWCGSQQPIGQKLDQLGEQLAQKLGGSFLYAEEVQK